MDPIQPNNLNNNGAPVPSNNNPAPQPKTFQNLVPPTPIEIIPTPKSVPVGFVPPSIPPIQPKPQVNPIPTYTPIAPKPANSIPVSTPPIMSSPVQAATHNPHKSTLITFVVIVVLVLLASIWWTFSNRGPVSTVKETASAGKVVTGFDPRFILVSDAKILESNNTFIVSKEKGDGTVLSTIYTTQSSATSLFTAYNDLLTNNSYEILQSTWQDEKGVILAVKAGDTVFVSIVDKNDLVRTVTISISKTVSE